MSICYFNDDAFLYPKKKDDAFLLSGFYFRCCQSNLIQILFPSIYIHINAWFCYQGGYHPQEVFVWISYIASTDISFHGIYTLLMECQVASIVFFSFWSYQDVGFFLLCTSFWCDPLDLKCSNSIAFLNYFHVMQVLPLPNIPFFWVLFRTYSHWRALQVNNV